MEYQIRARRYEILLLFYDVGEFSIIQFALLSFTLYSNRDLYRHAVMIVGQQKYQFSTIKLQMQQASVREGSLQLTDSTNVHKEVLMSCLLYSAEYYPIVDGWINNVVVQGANGDFSGVLLEAFEQLIQDLNREIVYGPSADYVAVSDRPHYDHLNSILKRQEKGLDPLELVNKAKNIIKNGFLGGLINEDQIQQLLWYRRSNHLKIQGFAHKKVSAETLKELEVNGESWTKTISLPTLLLTIEKTLKAIVSLKEPRHHHKFNLLLARVCFLHNKLLQNPAKDLADTILFNYRYFLKKINEDPQKDSLSYTTLLLEYANVLVFYYKYGECEKIIEFCKTIVNVDIQYSGKMGRRTKYQSFDTPQLVMNIKEKGQSTSKQADKQTDEVDKDAVEMPDAKQLVLKQLQTAKKGKGSQIETANFDQQNILLERPVFVDQSTSESSQLSTPKILVTLATIQYMWQTSPKQEMLYQYIATSLETILQYKDQLSYPVMFNILLLRSLNQFPRTKNIQRALDQLQKLKENFNTKTDKNVDYMYACSYTPFTEFIKILAQKYMEIGMTMTAIQLYQKVGMIQECIDGLIAKNFKERALALAVKYQKQHGRTPRLLCMLGDLQEGDKCVELYEEAWRRSQKRIARAQRSLGWHYFKKKQFVKAAQSFKNATQANFYHPSTWFTLGCCYMQLKQFQKAVPAFGQCVCIDETQGQAWGNIASCYIYQGRLKQAYSTLEQALKHSEKNWKLWANMLSVSLKLKKFYKYFECVEKLVEQQKSQTINGQILSKLIVIFQHQQETSQRRRLIQPMKNRLDRLYKFLVQKIGQNPIVWHSIHQYNLELQKFTKENERHYKKLHQQDKIDKNDILDGYETLEGTIKTSQQALRQLRQNIVSSKQTELNMTMKIGWESNKKQSQEVEQVLREYNAVYEKYGEHDNEQDEKQFALFVKGVTSKLESCLQRSVNIKASPK